MSEIYTPKKVQDLLGIDSSTLRKYATLLEGQGYSIHRNTKGHRGYFDKDVSTLRQLIEFNKQDGMSIEQAVITVMSGVSEKSSTGTDTKVVMLEIPADQDSKPDRNHDELLERIEHLEQINLDLINHLKEKAVREASLEEKLNQILRYVERTEQWVLERSKIEEETRNQIAAAKQKRWWMWWRA